MDKMIRCSNGDGAIQFLIAPEDERGPSGHGASTNLRQALADP